ncbi:MAG TPA: N-formylglutamate amidohydrolase [Chitinispirillaceae bacterium]|nr:N-formylglutamate amidohydrolase [Chitinispirillaceae bacterium]
MKMMASEIIITCEHGGNQIPEYLSTIFKDNAELLESHRGWDPGAIQLALKLSTELNCLSFSETISRLVIDQNRSLTNKQVFSRIAQNLTVEQKNHIISVIYKPYRNAIIACIEQLLNKQLRVCHFSIHSFTPVLNGVIRNADIGFLYDPRRKIEKDLCSIMIKKLESEITGIRVRRNYPYKGTSDGLTAALRKRFGADCYAGIEIEVNQLQVVSATELWTAIMEKLPGCIDYGVGKV